LIGRTMFVAAGYLPLGIGLLELALGIVVAVKAAVDMERYTPKAG